MSDPIKQGHYTEITDVPTLRRMVRRAVDNMADAMKLTDEARQEVESLRAQLETAEHENERLRGLLMGPEVNRAAFCLWCGEVIPYTVDDEVSRREAFARMIEHEGKCHKNPYGEEICICAAIKLDDGPVIRGHRHDDCILTALRWQKAGQNIGAIRQDQQGFITSRGRFVGREEGARLMKKAGMVSAHTGRRFDGDTLFSEDLY